MGVLESVSSFLNIAKKRGGDGFTSAGSPDIGALQEKVRHSELFRDLPPDVLDSMFAQMETVKVKSGDIIIKQGAEGDYYYLLVSGTVRVTRIPPDGGEPQVVAEICEPFGFGEEALISNALRNASITMTTAGVLMRLSKEKFGDYVRDPMLDWMSPVEAQDKVSRGAKWIDVRDKGGARESHLHGALAIPMNEIRNKASELDKNGFFICYCENGRLSATAAFLLRQRGFKVAVLRGGLRSLRNAGMA